MSEPASEPVSEPAIPISSTFCYFFGHLNLWGGAVLAFFAIIPNTRISFSLALWAMSSSLPLFVIAAHLRQQAVTNQLLEKIASKN